MKQAKDNLQIDKGQTLALTFPLSLRYSTEFELSYRVSDTLFLYHTTNIPKGSGHGRMAPIVHVLDTDYDPVIVLKNPSTTFAGVTVPTNAEEIHYHVSSRHLQLASPWFKRAMSKEAWIESDSENGYYHTFAQDWNEQSFLVLLSIFHLRHKQVRPVVSLDSLAEIAVLVDYYECGATMELLTDMWVSDLKKTASPQYTVVILSSGSGWLGSSIFLATWKPQLSRLSDEGRVR